MITIYHDPRFTLQELPVYKVPLILKYNDEFYYDSGSIIVISLGYKKPKEREFEKVFGVEIVANKYSHEDIDIDTEYLEKFDESKIEKFLIDSEISYYTAFSMEENTLLNIERAIENYDALITLNMNFLKENTSLVDTKSKDILFETLIYRILKKSFGYINIKKIGKYLFGMDVSNFENLQRFLENFGEFNRMLVSKTKNIQKIFEDKKLTDGIESILEYFHEDGIVKGFSDEESGVIIILTFQKLLDVLRRMEENVCDYKNRW